MKFLSNYWKVILAVILVAAAVFFFVFQYQAEKNAFEQRQQQMENTIQLMRAKIVENLKYKDIQDDLADGVEAINASRLDLYRKFPVKLREEDQIMYILYLETLFDTEIFFTFGAEAIRIELNDQSGLDLNKNSSFGGLLITVNYETTYEGFQEMIGYLATDNRIASVYNATINYDAENDVATGQLNLILYVVDTEALEYTAPDVAIPETGKDNIFE